MIQKYVDRFISKRPSLEAGLTGEPFPCYGQLVEMTVNAICEEEYEDPSPDRIHEINDGCCSGTLVYVIGESGYKPYKYWYVLIGYGSCSACDTLEDIRGYDDVVNPKQVKLLLDLCLHIVQKLKPLNSYVENTDE